MAAAIRGGMLYFAIAFAAGFVLGALRVTALAPALGEMIATLVELPIILGISWWACGYTIPRAAVPASPAARLVMGLVAFTCLMAAEVGLGLAMQGRLPTVETWLAAPKLVGLAGQVLFAAFPLLRLCYGRT